jgi:hypothetical protein
MKNNSLSLLGGILIVLVSVFAITAISIRPNTDTTTESTISYHSDVCKYVTRANGSIEDIGCSHNLLVDAGANAIRDALNTGAVGSFKWIALCNASVSCATPAITDTTLDNEYTTAGLNRSDGAYNAMNNGNWSIANTFTATQDNVLTNKTALFNASSADTMLAENEFTLVTLQTNDQLTINWTIWVG